MADVAPILRRIIFFVVSSGSKLDLGLDDAIQFNGLCVWFLVCWRSPVQGAVMVRHRAGLLGMWA